MDKADLKKIEQGLDAISKEKFGEYFGVSSYPVGLSLDENVDVIVTVTDSSTDLHGYKPPQNVVDFIMREAHAHPDLEGHEIKLDPDVKPVLRSDNTGTTPNAEPV